jgi:diguanylate cyclase (GGDEF)-like protein
MRTPHVRRPSPWQLLAAALGIMAVACGALVVTTPEAPPGGPGAPVARVLEQVVRDAPTDRAAVREFREMAEALVDAGLLLRAELVADRRPLLDDSGILAEGYRRTEAHTVVIERGSETWRLTVVPVEPADVSSFRNRDDYVMALLFVMLGITAGALWVSRRRNAEHQRIALLDPLTVGNRRHLDRLAARLLRDPADDRRHALLLLDLDRFKQLNDRYGHERGDAVLRRLAEALQVVVRPHDHVVRLGGDEFAVLLVDLPSGEPGDAVPREVLARLRERLPDLGISGGSAVWPRDAADLSSLTRVADRAMYADKERRRTIDLRDPRPTELPV